MDKKRSDGICIYFSHEVFPIKGGISRVSSLLAVFFKKKGFRVYFLSTTRRHKSFPAVENQYCIEANSGDKFLSFLREKEIKFFIDQSGGVPKFPYPRPPREVVFVSVLHFRPFFYSENVLEEKLRTIPIVGAIPFRKNFCKNQILKKIFSLILKFRLRHLYGNAIRQSDRFILLSDSYKDELKDILKRSHLPKNVHVIPNPCTLTSNLVAPIDKDKEIVWCGRIEYPFKRPDLLLQIWKRLQPLFPDWRVRFVGEGSYLTELKRLAHTLGAERVYFEGFCDPAPFYRKAAILCMTSLSEGFPMVLLEASACAVVPVLFNSFSSASDIISNNENGVLIEPLNLTEYTKIMEKLMSDDAFRTKVANNAQENAERFSLPKIGERWIDMFETICQEKHMNGSGALCK